MAKFVYCNFNPKQLHTNDCLVRALAYFFGDGDVQHGQISILEELRDLIIRGQNIERERILKHLKR